MLCRIVEGVKLGNQPQLWERETQRGVVFLGLRGGGQKGLRRKSRKRMNRLARNLGFRWFARYTFEPPELAR